MFSSSLSCSLSRSASWFLPWCAASPYWWRWFSQLWTFGARTKTASRRTTVAGTAGESLCVLQKPHSQVLTCSPALKQYRGLHGAGVLGVQHSTVYNLIQEVQVLRIPVGTCDQLKSAAPVLWFPLGIMPATNEGSVRVSHEPWEKIKLFLAVITTMVEKTEDSRQHVLFSGLNCVPNRPLECVSLLCIVQKTENRKKWDSFHIKIRFHDYMLFDLSRI